MTDILKQLVAAALSRRGGVAALLALAAAIVGAGAIPHDSPEGQAAGGAAGVVVVMGIAGLAKLALAKFGPKTPAADGEATKP